MCHVVWGKKRIDLENIDLSIASMLALLHVYIILQDTTRSTKKELLIKIPGEAT